MVARTSDSDLYKDKIEVSLDARQIFYLFFGGAVVAALVFVLGVMVGRRLEARAHVDKAAATSARRDPLAALDRLAQADEQMTFPAALGAGSGAGGGPVAEVDRAIAAMADPAERAGGDAAARKAAAEKAAAEKKAAEKKAAEKAAAEKAAAEKAAAEKRAAAEKAAAADDGPARQPDGAGKSGRAKFTLQLSAFQDRSEADAFLATVKTAGYDAYLVAAEVEGKGMFYRVRLGNYASYDDAVAAKMEFEKRVPKIAYVTRL